ncbi:hypothetical protein [Streptomyces sp. NBC_00448]|uniref:hypothetical protein n=1 Tax=Streptomyces sp. NBC_00448 TaxID=2903652 RepID=UPI002E1A4100
MSGALTYTVPGMRVRARFVEVPLDRPDPGRGTTSGCSPGSARWRATQEEKPQHE